MDLGHLGDLGFNSFLGCFYCRLLRNLLIGPSKQFSHPN